MLLGNGNRYGESEDIRYGIILLEYPQDASLQAVVVASEYRVARTISEQSLVVTVKDRRIDLEETIL